MTQNYPAPWNLTGKGYIFILKNRKKFFSRDNFTDGFFKNKFCGGWGLMMLVEYSESNAGPYNELLFIPGKFKFGNRKKYSITKIYVSSPSSVEWGRKNWAIPKELANIYFTEVGDNIENVNASMNGKNFFSILLRKLHIPFPVHTSFFPVPLLQIDEEHKNLFYTKFKGKGVGYPVIVKNVEINSDYFPEISKKQILFGIKVENFKITFPLPIIVEIQQ